MFRSYLISGLLVLALFGTAQYRGWSLFSASEAKKARRARREGFTINRIVVLYAHPRGQRSNANRRLIDAAAAVPGVAVRNLYERYPDFDIDAGAEQQAIQSAELLVFQYPTYWYSPPPLLKLWIDTVLEPGWAYGPGGTALAGKHWWCVTTTGGARAATPPITCTVIPTKPSCHR